MAEPFDWMEAKRNPEVARAQKARREDMYRTEIEERAALLQRLGYTKDSTRTRLRANVRWDFDGAGAPVTEAQIDAIVDQAFGGKPGGRTKGGAR